MARPVLKSGFDVALWFHQRAIREDERIGVDRLHWLVFMSQLLFAERYNGQMLIPCYFVVRKQAPIEPHVDAIFSRGHPVLGASNLPMEATLFLEDIWLQRSNICSQGVLAALRGNPAFQQVLATGEGSTISFETLLHIAALEKKHSSVKKQVASNQSDIEEILDDGRVIRRWQPKVSKPNRHYLIENIKPKPRPGKLQQ